MAVWMPSVLAWPKSSANSAVQSMVYFWILIISDSSAEIIFKLFCISCLPLQNVTEVMAQV